MRCCKLCKNFSPSIGPWGECRGSLPTGYTNGLKFEGRWPLVKHSEWCARFDPVPEDNRDEEVGKSVASA
jgi:hypothetical protein